MASTAFLVHGIRDTAGNGDPRVDWYPRIEAAFDPSIRCVPIRYREHHGLVRGALGLVFWPWAFVLLAGATIVNWPDYWWLGALLPLFVTIVSIAEERRWTLRWPARQTLLLHAAAVAIAWSGLVAGRLFEQTQIGVTIAVVVTGWLIARLELTERREFVNVGSTWSKPLPWYCLMGCLSIAFWGQYAFFATIVLLTIIGIVEPLWRRERTVEAVAHQLAANLPNPLRRVHVVAHSLGTVVSYRAIHRLTMQRWGRMICVGSALPTKAEWPLLGGAGLYDVHNEIGKKDVVIRTAGWLEAPTGWFSGLGGGGHRGFCPDNAFHNGKALQAPCEQCGIEPFFARLHNWGLSENRHSTSLLTEDHALYAWLPFLWGFHVADCNDFFEWCQEASIRFTARDADGCSSMLKRIGGLRAWWRPLEDERLTLLDYTESCLRKAVEKRIGTTPRGLQFWKRHYKVYAYFFGKLIDSANRATSTALSKSGSATGFNRRFRMVSPVELHKAAVKDTVLALQNGLLL